MPIRKKIVCATVLLAATLLILIGSSLRGFYAYRELVLIVSNRVSDLPMLNDRIVRDIDELRVRCQPTRVNLLDPTFSGVHGKLIPLKVVDELRHIRENVKSYEILLRDQVKDGVLDLDPTSQELKLVSEITSKINSILHLVQGHEVQLNPQLAGLENDLYDLSGQAHELPVQLHDRMKRLREHVRGSYRTLYGMIMLSSLASFLIIGLAYTFFRRSVVQPFKELLAGSRTIAKGNFDHRVVCNSGDELSELADALNAMTDRFVQIRDHLNETVQARTREVVRSEQLASVGFLAAGVAHEINNPLASIAWSAEALESRLHEVLHADDHCSDQAPPFSGMAPAELDIVRKYLKRIQDEAFRCKGITERLLDFSRLGESQRKQQCDVNELVSDVIALVEHLTPYRHKTIKFIQYPGLEGWVSPTEFKQVVLNLLTNALDSTDQTGVVTLQLGADHQRLSLVVEDNGCGMTEEVLRHLYEPFFTRRRDGKGTGLGLSITYRIVQDHGGQITASSDGPGHGSRFQILLPLVPETTNLNDSEKFAA